MKLTNEQKKTAIKRVLIAGAIFTVGAIVYNSGFSNGGAQGYVKGFNDALDVYGEEKVITKGMNKVLAVGPDGMGDYLSFNGDDPLGHYPWRKEATK